MEKIIIHHNTGLGDHLICNGLVNYISQEKKVYLISNNKNYFSVKYLYSENKNVVVLPIFRNNKIEYYLLKFVRLFNKEVEQSGERLLSKIYSKILRKKIIYIGFEDVVYPEWDKSFYKILKLDFNIRYDFFDLPKKLPKRPENIPNEFIFIQDISSQGKYELKINSSKDKIFLGSMKTKNFFENLFFVQAATEIHCIDSSLVHLVESIIPNKSQKIFFHDVERYNQDTIPHARFNMRHDWKIVKYKKNSSFY
jgi:hypothetical protein